MEYEGERKGSAPMSTPPPYLFQQPPPHYFTDQQRVLLQCAYQLPSETQVSHSQQTRIASEWRISPLQAEGCSDVIINAAHPTPNHATDYYLLTIVLLVTCGLMGNLVTFFCLVPALFSASMARIENDKRNNLSASRWAVVTLCLNIIAILFSLLMVVTAASYVSYSAAL